ncbi:hypothetical protein ES703_65914 [subsurface metagenome]
MSDEGEKATLNKKPGWGAMVASLITAPGLGVPIDVNPIVITTPGRISCSITVAALVAGDDAIIELRQILGGGVLFASVGFVQIINGNITIVTGAPFWSLAVVLAATVPGLHWDIYADSTTLFRIRFTQTLGPLKAINAVTNFISEK